MITSLKLNELIKKKDKNGYNIAYSGQWLVGSLLRFVRFAHFTTQATHQPPPHMRFRYVL